jgi:hypothetical protein
VIVYRANEQQSKEMLASDSAVARAAGVEQPSRVASGRCGIVLFALDRGVTPR